MARAVALFTCEGQGGDEISFKEGQSLTDGMTYSPPDLIMID